MLEQLNLVARYFPPAYIREDWKRHSLTSMCVCCPWFRMHAQGVNLRHMGRIRDKMTSPKGRRLLLSLGLSRAFKTKLRRKLRASVQLQEHAGASSEVSNVNWVIAHTHTHTIIVLTLTHITVLTTSERVQGCDPRVLQHCTGPHRKGECVLTHQRAVWG
jgi:hypothetical protein